MGSTGSIGTQTLDIISEHPELFHADCIVAGSNWELLAKQAKKYHPDVVVIDDERHLPQLQEALGNFPIEIRGGRKAVESAGCGDNTDIVVGALVGYAGLIPTLNAIRCGKTIALANKETLVVAGEIMTSEARKYGVDIIPVDSEHSAIFQCLVGERHSSLSRIFLTASGGPFRDLPKEKFGEITLAQALKHPNWSMGAKVTIDSASMMNKGFEMIEAKWLFDTNPDDIKVVVHPQSIVHSMVEFCDGSVKAQLGLPDMHTPIRYALGYPERIQSSSRRLDIEDFCRLDFMRPDYDKFPMLGLAYQAIHKGGNMPCILNAANEVAVKAFLNERIPFIRIPEIAEATLDFTTFNPSPTLEDLILTHNEATLFASSLI